jgi:hypothetical protein
LSDNAFCGTLRVEKQAIICPQCSARIRGLRVPPGGALRGVDLMCSRCGMTMIVNIDETSATFSGQRH